MTTRKQRLQLAALLIMLTIFVIEMLAPYSNSARIVTAIAILLDAAGFAWGEP